METIKLLISGTKAAKILGLKNNKAFVEACVRNNQIKPTRFPGRKRLSYRRDEVENLIKVNSFLLTEPEQKNDVKEYVWLRAQVHSVLFT